MTGLDYGSIQLYSCASMTNSMITTNITFPKDDWKALKVLAITQGISMAEFVRRVVGKSVRKNALILIRQRRLTINGFTPEFEAEVLKAAEQPMDQDVVLKPTDAVGKFMNQMLIEK